ncbi:hypothetical protein Sps_03749 [Shewanella psychrophila]|uniref:Uncharacterized protein n=1 Tax=Shewanella psychrophila TaxID=225848 RepID=A0A1S6HTI3_9GAMM|nr:hypothetical protein Sps_03749 [Shewanella psychrophila]
MYLCINPYTYKNGSRIVFRVKGKSEDDGVKLGRCDAGETKMMAAPAEAETVLKQGRGSRVKVRDQLKLR